MCASIRRVSRSINLTRWADPNRFDLVRPQPPREEFELPLQVQLLLDDKDAEKRVPVPASKAEQVLEVDPKEPRLGRNGKV